MEGYVTVEEFSRLDIRVGTVVTAEKVEGSRKLLRLIVDLGELGQRQIVAGIGERYEPEQLVGRQIVVLANMAPRRIMGVVSQGMLLAAGCDDRRPVLLVPVEPVRNGSKVC